MIIDFHTHVFPDKIAEKTIKLLEAKGGIPSFSDGTADGLTCALEDAGVDIAVTLPVLTNPKSFDSVNRYAAEINARFENESRRLISFGAIHPACENIEGKMKEIMMPVTVMDEDCWSCEFLDIESCIKRQMWAEEVCIEQELEIRCKDVHKCERLMKRAGRTTGNGTSAIRR